MSIVNKHWMELREVPGDDTRMSYVRLHDIERISFMETGEHEYPIYIHVLGEEYLYNIVETLQEAQSAAKGIIEDIERSKSGK